HRPGETAGMRPGRRRGNLPGTSQAPGTGRDRRLWSLALSVATEGETAAAGSHSWRRNGLRVTAYRALSRRAGSHARHARLRLTRWPAPGRPPPGAGPRQQPGRPAPGAVRTAGAGTAARPGGAEPGADLDDRPRLPRHRHARRHPPQRVGEPGLVHVLHALP